MKALLIIINILLWLTASVILAVSLESVVFGVLYFFIGFPLSLVLIRLSDDYAISFLDRLSHPPFSVWLKKLLWSNGVATVILWVGIIIITYVFRT